MTTSPLAVLAIFWSLASCQEHAPTAQRCSGLHQLQSQAPLDCTSADDANEAFGTDGSLNLLQTKAILRPAAAVARVSLEPVASLPSGFEVMGPSPKTETIRLSFFVKNQKLDVLEQLLMNVSDPLSASYGKHWVNADVQRLVAPSEDDSAAVQEFLQEHGLEVIKATPSGDVLTAVTTTEHAEHILQAKYEAISHLKTGQTMHRCLSGYTLPTRVAAALDFVSPTVHLMSPPQPTLVQQGRHIIKHHASSNGGQDESFLQESPPQVHPPIATTTTTTTLNCNTTYNCSLVCPDFTLYPTDPKALRALYSIGGSIGQDTRSRQAVTGFTGQTYNLQNLRDYWTLLCDGIMCGKGDPGNVGSATEGDDHDEAMLDVDVMTSVAGNIYTEFWGFLDPSGKDDPFVMWLIKVARTNDNVVPKIFSTSYGEDEDAYSQTASVRLNVEFMKMGVRGISVLFASGDEGANLQKIKGNSLRPDFRFVPEGPGTSPFVTAVGATAPTEGFPAPGSETATSLSSGGFSNYWARPWYQDSAVKSYLQRPDLPNLKQYKVHTNGRAYPDVALQGYSYCVTPDLVQGVLGCGVGGTSAATPGVAGIFSLLNDLRLGLGKSTLGFLNPLIYRYPEAFTDITTGYNTQNGGCTSAPAWPAAKGWDAVTGVGTPNYAKLAEIARKLP